jgi:hypothetical protein
MTLSEKMFMITNAAIKEKEDENFPWSIYNFFIRNIKTEAEKGNFSFKYTLEANPTDIFQTDSFLLFQRDFISVRNKLKEDGFNVTTNLYTIGEPIWEYYVLINWNKNLTK